MTRRKFCLPTTVLVSVHKNERGKMIAHALDFDLVAAGDSMESAMQKLMTSMRVYVEHGIMNNATDQIPCPAPDRYWPPEADHVNARQLPPLEVDDSRMRIWRTIAPSINNNEAECLASMA